MDIILSVSLILLLIMPTLLLQLITPFDVSGLISLVEQLWRRSVQLYFVILPDVHFLFLFFL